MRNVKILILDIETAPAQVLTWGLFDQNMGINQIVHDEYLLCWSAKWYGEKHVYADALINYPSAFKKDPTNDKNIAESIWKLLDQADIVVTHNGENFDLKWLNSTFLKHKLPPVSGYKSVDTLRESRSNFRFLSHKLDFISRRLGIGSKVEHEGFNLWVKCMAGDKKSWAHMIRYNANDVLLLEEAYDIIRPFMRNHPNVALYEGRDCCPVCGHTEFTAKGYAYTSTNKYPRFKCKKCGKNVRGSKSVLADKERKEIRRSV